MHDGSASPRSACADEAPRRHAHACVALPLYGGERIEADGYIAEASVVRYLASLLRAIR
jgi:hypothetical protein